MSVVYLFVVLKNIYVTQGFLNIFLNEGYNITPLWLMSRTVLNYIPVKIKQVNPFKFQGKLKDRLRNKRELPFDDFI